jgi:putative glycosyltransferase (TIGR04348 family)
VGGIPHLQGRRLDICLITPAPAGSRAGNRVTALRWARILRGLGHRVVIEREYRGRPCDLMIALHARRSFASVDRFHRRHPDRPLLLALTGTDLYGLIRTDPLARRALEMATRLIVLQPMGASEIPAHLRARARVIYQSVRKPHGTVSPRRRVFEVCVLGHLRPVKDPFRTAEASRLLPAASRIQVVHAGAALGGEMEERARAEAKSNPRYHWVGEVPRWKALRLLARSRLLVLSSQMEGGANVVSEAIATSTPVLASRIPGSVGLLGEDYPGYFPVGDTQALADLLHRAETDRGYYRALKAWCRRLLPLVDPRRERASWQRLLREVRATG